MQSKGVNDGDEAMATLARFADERSIAFCRTVGRHQSSEQRR
jgi:hypothetical protein